MAQEEQVLVVPRNTVERIGMFQGLMFNVNDYLNAFFKGAPLFIARPEAEKNPEYKQLIPYVVMSCNGKFLTYVRGKRAGETRLVGNRSIGIGGHVNPVDDVSLLGFRETYLNAVHREVEEEIHVGASHKEQIIALLNDDSNEVGQVHLGVVHHWILDSEDVTRKEQMINQLAFMSIPQLLEVRDEMETWSQLCLDYLVEREGSQRS